MTQAKAWDGVFETDPEGRSIKPRRVGLSMVIDKNLGTRRLADLLETAGEVIDHIKFAFGSTIALDEKTIRTKLEMIRAKEIEVYPGGTLGEAAILQGVFPEFLKRARVLGFTMIEISDGTIAMTPRQRADVIARTLDNGLGVISEVGKKDPGQKLPVGAMQAQIAADLAQGASYVIIEAREGGKGIGIYDKDGAVDEPHLNALVEGLEDLERIVWEAPQCSQQGYLINRFGANANLGNIQPLDVLGLEAMRRGLRFETLRQVKDRRQNGETGTPLPVLPADSKSRVSAG